MAIVKHNHENSYYGVMDASYFRLKSLEIAYTIDKKVMKEIGLAGCQFFLNGNNLFTLSNYDHRIDPESASTSNYPLTKRYNIGFRLKF